MKTIGMWLLFALALGLLLALGSWQVERGWQKSQILAQLSDHSQEYKPLNAIPHDFAAFDYHTVTLTGQWLNNKEFLLGNRFYQQQIGYEVLAPFRLPSGQLLLINRGWISAIQAKTIPVATATSIQGTLYVPKKGYTLGNSITDNSQWPRVSLYIDNAAFSQALGETVLPIMLVLDQQQTDSFTRIWQPVIMSPERHYAYALQWFGLAFTLLVFGFIWRKRGRNSV